MSLSARWHRLDASAWVHRLLVLQVVLLGLLTAVAFFAGLAMGALWIALIPGAITALAGRLARAWDDERRWSWWAVVAVTVHGTAANLLGLASGLSFWRVAWLLVDAALLALLVHPDSTARLDPRPRRERAPLWVADRPPRV